MVYPVIGVMSIHLHPKHLASSEISDASATVKSVFDCLHRPTSSELSCKQKVDKKPSLFLSPKQYSFGAMSKQANPIYHKAMVSRDIKPLI